MDKAIDILEDMLADLKGSSNQTYMDRDFYLKNTAKIDIIEDALINMKFVWYPKERKC